MKKTIKIKSCKGVYRHNLQYPIEENDDIVLDKIDALHKKYKGIYKTKCFYKIENPQPKEMVTVLDTTSFNAMCSNVNVYKDIETYRCDHVYYITIYYKKKRKKKKKKKDNPVNCFGDPITPPHYMGRDKNE